MVHGEAWTLKEFFVYPNEYIYWSIQIVMYPFMTGLVAGAFVLSSLYHVFGVKQLKDIARFSLVFSLALLPVAMMPLMLHLQQPQRGIYVMMTPHFTSAIAAFGIVFTTYGLIVASEIWFVYRQFIVETVLELRAKQQRSAVESAPAASSIRCSPWAPWISARRRCTRMRRAVGILAGIGIPVACFLHGYAGFIFGSVKANALWMTPLMPVIFICSAVVSGIALCIVTYIVTMEIRKLIFAWKRKNNPRLPSTEELKSAEILTVTMTVKYLVMFLVLAITLELLDLIFRTYTAVKSWDILRSVIYERDFFKIFILQYGLGNRRPVHHLPEAGADHPTGAGRHPAGADGRLHDALERRYRRPGLLRLLLRIYGVSSPHLAAAPLNCSRKACSERSRVIITPFVLFFAWSPGCCRCSG